MPSSLRQYIDINFYYAVLRGERDLSPVLKVVGRAVALLVVSVYRFIKGDSVFFTSALTFYSMLAFIPVLALILAIARGFGAARALESWIADQSYMNPEVMKWVMDVADKALANSNSGVVTGFGILLLLWSVIRMLSGTEMAMNRIWGIRVGRSLKRKITDYLSVIFIAPIMVVLISSINVFMTSNLQHIAMEEGLLGYAGAAIVWLLKLLPYLLVWLLFVFLYMFVPTTPVRFKHALLAGVLAGTVFQVVQWFYIRFQIGMSSYNAIYGGLAALPLLLVWLQLSWSIVLWGTELCYVSNNRHFVYASVVEQENRWIGNIDLSAKVLRYVARQYLNEGGAVALESIRNSLGMDADRLRVALREMVAHGILVQVESKADLAYLPAMDFHDLPVSEVVIRLSYLGNHADREWEGRFIQAIRKEFGDERFV